MLEPSELFPEVPNLYEFLSVHSDMLFDEERVNRYSDAINQQVKPGDIVADIGTGTGLLAFLCIRAGAKRVHAMERSAALKWAKTLAEHHGLSERIIFYATDSRNVELPEMVDVVLSETIGHIAFEEGMVESIFDAKSRFLSPNGKIIPQEASLKLAPVCEENIYKSSIECWKNTWDIEFSLLRKDAVKACYLTEISDRELMAIPQAMFNVDFIASENLPTLDGTCQFKISRAGNVNGIALWFDAILAPDVYLSSGPWKRTHWLQCFAPIEKPLQVKAGDNLRIDINMQLRTKKHKSFNFEFKIEKDS
jgi:ubiquinone/menaquinone biosynthesis C-methylase UbiE